MIKYRTLAVAAFVLVPTAACDVDGTPAEGGSPGRGSETIDLELDMELGSLTGESDAFASVSQILPREDGSSFILDQAAKEILEFSPSGQLVRRFGRAGSGPGEFLIPGSIGWWAGQDSIWVADAVLPRVSVFSTAGELGRTIAVPGGGFSPTTAESRWHRVLGLESIVVVSQSRPVGGAWGPVQVTLADPSERILEVERDESSISIVSSEPGFMRDPIADGSLIRFSPNEERIIVVERAAPESAARAFVVVHAVDQRGDTLWTTRLEYQPTRIPVSVRDSIAHAAYERLQPLRIRRDLTSREFDRIYRETIQLPFYYPPVTSALATGNGDVWVIWTNVGDGTGVTILDRFGREVRQLRVEEEVAATLTSAAGDFVWAIAKGPYDIALARRYRLR